MALNTGLTLIPEEEIARHRELAQSYVTRFVVLEGDKAASSAPIAGTGRRFISPVSSTGLRKTREVELVNSLQAISADPMLSPGLHSIAYRARRAIMIALAVATIFARQTELETLEKRNAGAPLQGGDAEKFHALLNSASYVAAFAFAAYLSAMLAAKDEPAEETAEPDILFESPQESLKSLVAGLELSVRGSASEAMALARVRAFARTSIEALLQRKSRFAALGGFENVHLRVETDDFDLNGFDLTPSERRKPLVMTFRKPEEVIGNHIAKYQGMKLARMIMAYDFERQLNPFAELGGFIFTFIGDGMPGTGKTTLIQMIAGLINDYCQVAGYTFHYENFGVDQISSYQGKSGQNCKAFIENITNPRVIGFGTIDDVDQVAARRSDDRASAGQQEVTAVLMESFAGASTVVRGNCTFGMFSNYPENVDDALRQRAGARWLVDGPQTRDDYIDIFALLVGKNHSIPLGEHALYANQQIKKAVNDSYSAHERPHEQGLLAVWERFEKERGGLKSLADVGTYLFMIRQAEPRFTGRAIKNIADAIKMRAMDFELPDDWFERPDIFLHKSYDVKKQMIEELRGPIALDMVLQEINRYADSEFRYADKSDDAAVNDLVRREKQRDLALHRIEELKSKGEWN